ncbi:MAG: IS3 family transposase [Verrucomicrobia bacterium]|nr:IS3 family transposase [Verrucomicrobiota bacterium]
MLALTQEDGKRSALERELVHRVRFTTRAEAKAAGHEWIEIFYNRERFP